MADANNGPKEHIGKTGAHAVRTSLVADLLDNTDLDVVFNSETTLHEHRQEEDAAEWAQAEEFGYSPTFPYHLKEPVINQSDSLPSLVDEAMSPRHSSAGDLFMGVIELIPKQKIEKPGFSDTIEHVEERVRKMSFIHPTLKTTEDMCLFYKPKILIPRPWHTSEAGEQVQPTLHGTGSPTLNVASSSHDIKPEDRARRRTIKKEDKETQVMAVDILNEDRCLEGYEPEEVEPSEGEGEEATKERKSRRTATREHSLRRDDAIMVRPAGYKPLELTESMEPNKMEIETYVTERLMDEEEALARGIVLEPDNILWPSIDEFSVENGRRRISDYIRMCWQIDRRWMYIVRPIQTFVDNVRSRYVFEAIFSIPTENKPEPEATASVFFTVDISHFAQKSEMIKVHYVVEGTRFPHRPGSIPFQDKWLWSVIVTKKDHWKSFEFALM